MFAGPLLKLKYHFNCSPVDGESNPSDLGNNIQHIVNSKEITGVFLVPSVFVIMIFKLVIFSCSNTSGCCFLSEGGHIVSVTMDSEP